LNPAFLTSHIGILKISFLFIFQVVFKTLKSDLVFSSQSGKVFPYFISVSKCCDNYTLLKRFWWYKTLVELWDTSIKFEVALKKAG